MQASKRKKPQPSNLVGMPSMRILIAIVFCLATSISAQSPQVSKPLPPILLTAIEAQPITDAIRNEQMADLAKAKALAERQAAFYKFCAEHSLKPDEWEIRNNPQGGYIAINILKKGEKAE